MGEIRSENQEQGLGNEDGLPRWREEQKKMFRRKKEHEDFKKIQVA